MNRLLLDTNALIWWLAGGAELTERARAAISSTETEVHVSAASVWEMSIKRALGRLDTAANLTRTIQTQGFEELPVHMAHAEAAGALPLHHGDPFDRVLIAQAMLEDLMIVTRDRAFEAYGVPLLEA